MASYDRMSALDRSFLDLEDASAHMHVAGCFIFEGGPLRNAKGRIDADRITRYIESRLHQIARYRQRVITVPVDGEPVWIDDESFNIHYHVRHASLPEPGDERQLKRMCGRILSQQLDRGKPLWEMWVVEGLEHDRIALISKTHHCMIDGLSGLDLLQVLLAATPQKTFEEGPRWLPRPAPSPLELVRDTALHRARAPLRLASAALAVLRNPSESSERAAETLRGLASGMAARRPTADTPLGGAIGPHRRFEWLAFDLEEVKRVKNALGGTLNDVVLATVAGAIGRFFEQRGVPRHRQRKLEFRAFCPLSVRSESERATLGSRVSSLIAPLPIGQKDAKKRLRAVSRTMADLVESKRALAAEALTSVSEWIASTLVSMAARSAFRSASNLVVANVPGPQVPLYLLESRMAEAYPMLPLFERQGLGIALFSYAGGLYWGLNADWDLLPDLHHVVEALDASFHELCLAADEA